MAEALVIIENLTKSFQHMGRTLDVLKGIDLNIYPGQILSIVGPSGAGKSTLLHCVGTLDVPSSGRIRLGGEELTRMSSARLAAVRNRDIGFVFQFHHLLPEFTALENVMMPGLIQGRSKREMEKRAMALLEEVGLKPRVTHRPGELSGGEQQRVAVARALVLDPKLLLADEPTGNLDTATSDDVHELFFEINRRHGTTIIVVTHNPAFAERMPRVVRMRDGFVELDDVGKAMAPSAAPAAAAAATPAESFSASLESEGEGGATGSPAGLAAVAPSEPDAKS
ncbi:MAG TPA: ABC transporter ATP-binding protein [Polyangiaceae bacterium]|nr:ABC transporter ATP-binding protein [Polyangiaceae bacterium]